MNNYYNNPQNYNNVVGNNYNNQKKFFDPYQGFIRGNLEIDTFKPYKNQTPQEILPINDQARILTTIDSLGFAMTDLNLYLDVYPDDKEAINLFNQYRYERDQMVKNYESAYGPLTTTSDAMNAYPWIWNERPWPWER